MCHNTSTIKTHRGKPSATAPVKRPKNSNRNGNKNRNKTQPFSLVNTIYRKEWDGVENACLWAPSQAKVCDRLGDLPLHEACSLAAPFHVIKNLIVAYPAGVKEKGFCGRLPLHYAAYSKPSLNIIKLLLKNYPEGASTLDSDGRLPVHLAVIRDAPKSAIQQLVSVYPKSLHTQNNFGSTPQMLARNEHIETMLQEEEARPRNLSQNMNALNKMKMLLNAPNAAVSNNVVKRKQSVKSPLIERATGQYKNLQNQTHRHQGRRIFPSVEKVKKQRKEIFVTTRISIPTPPGTAASSIIPARN